MFSMKNKVDYFFGVRSFQTTEGAPVDGPVTT